MPESPKAFIRHHAPRSERWVFTRYELEHPENCRGEDEFMAQDDLGHGWLNTYRSDEEPEVAGMYKNVYVGRNLAQNDDDEQCLARRSVYVTADGKFNGWAQVQAKDAIEDEV